MLFKATLTTFAGRVIKCALTSNYFEPKGYDRDNGQYQTNDDARG